MNDLTPLTKHKFDEAELPTVTVFNWVYNHKDYVKESIESILMQKTNFKVEIIIHDDASNDGTKEIVLDYQDKYPFLFNNILHEENQWSQGKSVMTPLFEKPKGKYIALTHGDDYWTDPYKLQKQIDFLKENSDYMLTYHPCMEQINGKLFKEKMNTSDVDLDLSLELLLKENRIHTPSVCFRNVKFLVPDWFKDSPAGDYPLWILLGLKGRIRYFAENMSVYRIHETSTWSSQNFKHRGTRWLKVLDLISTELNDNQVVIIRKQYKNFYNRLILEFRLNFDEILDLNKNVSPEGKMIDINCKNYLDIALRLPISISNILIVSTKNWVKKIIN